MVCDGLNGKKQVWAAGVVWCSGCAACLRVFCAGFGAGFSAFRGRGKYRFKQNGEIAIGGRGGKSHRTWPSGQAKKGDSIS